MCEDTVVATFYKNGLSETIILPKESSVFSAEAYAIKKTVSIPNIRIELIILTGSASCLQALELGTLKKIVDPRGWAYCQKQKCQIPDSGTCWYYWK